MKTTYTTTIILALATVFTLADTTSAAPAVAWDGSGSPTSAGFSPSGTTSHFVFDSDNGTPNSQPGVMYQNSTNSGNWEIAAGLDNSLGWTVEVSFVLLANDDGDQGFAAAVELVNGGGKLFTGIQTFQVQFDDFQGGSSPTTNPCPNNNCVDGSFHTLKYVMPAGGTNAVGPEVFLDGGSLGNKQMTGSTEDLMSFGSHSGNNATIVWDSVNIGPIPEPSTAILMAMGLIGLAALGRRRSGRA